MTHPSPAATLQAFDALQRGDIAPEWLGVEIARAWGLPDVLEVRLIVISENVTLRVDVDGVPTCVVRLGRPGYGAGAVHVASEMHWVESLHEDTEIPMPRPLKGLDGEFVQMLVDPDGASWLSVSFTFLRGVILEALVDRADHFAEIGSITARLHTHARTWAPGRELSRFVWDTADLVGRRARWGDWRRAELSESATGLLEAAERRALQILADCGVDRSANHFGLIHADLRPSNIMVRADADGGLAIIDFDDCGFGYYMYDFAAALTFYEHRPEARRMAAAWLEGYAESAPMSAVDLRAAGAFSMLRRLTMLGWATTHRADSLPEDLWSENQPGTLEVAARFLADPDWLLRD
ncbi:phosphotransferase enzyme family protein [Microbacterium sp. E-13]|uniref:phosphotransferase enzyme family protein n=1 Tax=Microbacterium sp. E-13 TaxID=3404048 RepID=UPI003CF5471F